MTLPGRREKGIVPTFSHLKLATMSAQRYDTSAMTWTQEEELYLHSIQLSCEQLSNIYLVNFRKLRSIQAKIKIPIIIVGSFTGITSFGTETFPQSSQKWVSIGVGIITIIIAVLNTIESYFKIGENANAAINTTNALQQLREDINKELSLPPLDRQAPGLTFLRDCYTRYQQIMSQAPVLEQGDVYYVAALAASKLNTIIKKNEAKYAPSGANAPKGSTENGRRGGSSGSSRFSTESGKPPVTIYEQIARTIMGGSNNLSKAPSCDSKQSQTVMDIGAPDRLMSSKATSSESKEVQTDIKQPATLSIEFYPDIANDSVSQVKRPGNETTTTTPIMIDDTRNAFVEETSIPRGIVNIVAAIERDLVETNVSPFATVPEVVVEPTLNPDSQEYHVDDIRSFGTDESSGSRRSDT